MGLVGPEFVAGTAALAFLLAAEVVAAMAAVSEAALIYVARHRNMLISFVMIALQAVLTVGLILVMRDQGWPPMWPGDRAGDRAAAGAGLRRGRQVAAAAPDARRAGVGLALAADLGGGRGRRRRLAVHLAAAAVEWLELIVGIPAILLAFGAGASGPRASAPRTASCSGCGKDEIEELRLPPNARDEARRRADLVPEVPHAGEHHRQAGLVGGGDHLLVADRAARLDHRGRAGLGRGEQAVGEGEEGVGGDRRADRARLGPAIGSRPLRCAFHGGDARAIRGGSSGRRRCRR